MLLVSVLSSVAIVFGIGANLPQIARMHRARSAAGQSPVGWIMGAITNLCLAYVNLADLGANLLGAANLGSVLLCSIAVMLTLRFGSARGTEDQPAAVPAVAIDPATAVAGVLAAAPHELPVASIVASSHDVMVDMPTHEFALLHEAVRTAEQRRSAWQEERRVAAAETEIALESVHVSDGAPALAFAS